jgi:hypothetical protein
VASSSTSVATFGTRAPVESVTTILIVDDLTWAKLAVVAAKNAIATLMINNQEQ